MFSFKGMKAAAVTSTGAASTAAARIVLGPQTPSAPAQPSVAAPAAPPVAAASAAPPLAAAPAAQPLDSGQPTSAGSTTSSVSKSNTGNGSAGGMAARLLSSAVGEDRAAELKERASALASSASETLAARRSDLQAQMEDALQRDDGTKLSALLDSALASQAFDVPGVQMAANKQARKQLTEALKSEDRKRLKGALVAAKRLRATGLPEFELVTQKYRELSKLPPGWDVESMVRERKRGRLMARAELDDADTLRLFQRLFDGTHRAKWTRDRRESNVPGRYEVVRVVEVQNDALWVDYAVRQEEIRCELRSDGGAREAIWTVSVASGDAVPSLPGPPLDRGINEAWLFHGTNPIAVEKITAENFSLNFAGTSTGTLYGRGLYFAEHCTKADEYAREGAGKVHTMIVCRVTLGNGLYTDEVQPDPRVCEELCMNSVYHSVVGDRIKCRGTFREFVVFDEAQVYANFVVQYRRRP